MNETSYSQNKLKNHTDNWFWTQPYKIFEVLEVAGAEVVVEKKLF